MHSHFFQPQFAFMIADFVRRKEFATRILTRAHIASLKSLHHTFLPSVHSMAG